MIGIEPDPELLPLARNREGEARVLHGSAEQNPLPDASVDVVHARFAYFFPHPDYDCDPALAEVARVLAPGGALVVIDNDHENGEFAELLAGSPGAAAQGEGRFIENWWTQRGASDQRVLSSWRFNTREDLEAVLRLEFPGLADRWLDQHPGKLELTYGYRVFTWRKDAAA